MRLLFTFFTVFYLAFLAVVSLNSAVFAATPVSTPTPTPVVTSALSEVNSFEAFWPVVAGKTQGESLYFLKELKEQVRGWLIFGTPQKLDYSVFLTTKRVLESEKLLDEGKVDLAKSTLFKAQDQLDKASMNMDSAKSGNNSLAEVSGVAGSRLSNVSKLTAWLATKDGNKEVRDLLMRISSEASLIASKF